MCLACRVELRTHVQGLGFSVPRGTSHTCSGFRVEGLGFSVTRGTSHTCSFYLGGGGGKGREGMP